jgi:hypothetical protein
MAIQEDIRRWRDLNLPREGIKKTSQDHGYIETGWNVPLLRECLADKR